MLRELFYNDEWVMLKQQSEDLCEKAGPLPEEIPLYAIYPKSESDAEIESADDQDD